MDDESIEELPHVRETAAQCRRRIIEEQCRESGELLPEEIEERATEVRQLFRVLASRVEQIELLGCSGDWAQYRLVMDLSEIMEPSELASTIVEAFEALNAKHERESYERTKAGCRRPRSGARGMGRRRGDGA